MSNDHKADSIPPYGRAFAADQALASAKLEGFEPGAELLADWAKLAAGTMTGDEFKAHVVARSGKI